MYCTASDRKLYIECENHAVEISGKFQGYYYVNQPSRLTALTNSAGKGQADDVTGMTDTAPRFVRVRLES